MTVPLRTTSRLRPGRFRIVCALLVLGGAPAPLAAQVPDTVPARTDTVRVPGDTLPADPLPQRPDTPADTLAQDTLPPPPPPRMPEMRSAIPAGFATGVWVWDREALVAEPFLSVSDLLDRVPGVVTLRPGLHLHPEGASTWGASAGAVEVELDGYSLWPLDDPTFDLSQIELGTLESVRIERRAAGVRIVLRTVEPFSGEPYTRIEAGIGEPIGVNLFRGVFLAPRFAFGPFAAGVERFESEGIGARENADLFTGWLKWGVIGTRAGVQVEYRQQSFDRAGATPWPTDNKRRDVVLRTRWAPTGGLALEAYGGYGSAEIDAPETEPLERDVIQAGTRGALNRGPLSLEAGVRFNNERRLPITQADARSWLQLGRFLGVGGEVQHARWRDEDATLAWQVQGVLSPVSLLSLFAQYGGGTRGAPAWESRERYILESEHTQLRAGGQLRWGLLDVGGAFLRVERDTLFGFGLPFDSAAAPLAGGTLEGWELYGRVPLFRDIVAVDGALTNWTDWETSIYAPTRSWRAALSAHLVPLASGNLDILARVQARDRGAMLLPTRATAEQLDLDAVPGRTILDGLLVIRIVSVQAFLRYEDMSGQGLMDVPGRVVPGPRILYGVKWSFTN